MGMNWIIESEKILWTCSILFKITEDSAGSSKQCPGMACILQTAHACVRCYKHGLICKTRDISKIFENRKLMICSKKQKGTKSTLFIEIVRWVPGKRIQIVCVTDRSEYLAYEPSWIRLARASQSWSVSGFNVFMSILTPFSRRNRFLWGN